MGNEDFIVTNCQHWSPSMTASLTYTLLLVLTRDDMERLLKQYPEFRSQVRKHAVKIAFRRALALTAIHFREKFACKPEYQSLSLVFSSKYLREGSSSLALAAAPDTDPELQSFSDPYTP